VPPALQLTGRLADRDAWTAERCSLAAALDVVRTKSAVLLLREAAYGATRFDDLVRRAQVSEPVAAARLRELCDAGLLEREDYKEPGQRTRRGYALTAMGRDLVPALLALMAWGDRWLAEDGGPLRLTHRDCGEEVAVELRCAHGHHVAPDELDVGVRRRGARP
jgi:DNA-binding HxlR family transcriptional regulator